MNANAPRTDIHRTIEIIPANYIWIGVFYQGASDDEMLAYRPANLAHANFTTTATTRSQQVFHGNHTDKGSCDICGANFAHGAYFLHTPTGDIIHTGQDCAEKLDLAAGSDMANTRGAIRAAATAAKTARLNLTYRAMLLFCVPQLRWAFTAAADSNSFVGSVRARFQSSHPELSERQVLAVIKAAERDVERAAVQAVEAEEAAPVVEGKGVTITGEVKGTKAVESDYGVTVKMLVRDDRGFKVWVTVPAFLNVVAAGDRVTFVANVTVSRGDASFGFGARPRAVKAG